MPVHQGCRGQYLHRRPRPYAAAYACATGHPPRRTHCDRAGRGTNLRPGDERDGVSHWPHQRNNRMTSQRPLLEGIRVLDLTNVLSGPFATLHLALLGAEVIKVENPKDGDLARKLGCVPEYNRMLMGTSFLAQNANKKSLTLNLKNPQGKEILRRLVPTADVLVENFRP